jgi:hypothetical protein
VFGVVQQQPGVTGRGRAHGGSDLGRVAHPGQLDDGGRLGQVGDHRAGQPGLARATRPGQRDQPVRGEPARDQGQLGLPADEAGQRRRRGRPRPVGPQHGQVRGPQLGRRVHPEPLGERGGDRGVVLERLGGPPVGVQGAQQQRVRPLPGGVHRHDRLQFGDHAGRVGPAPQVGLRAVLAGGEPQLVQPGRRGHRERRVGQVGQRVAAPKGQRGVQVPAGGVGPPGLQRRPPGSGQPLEAERVHRVRGQVEAVAVGQGGHRSVRQGRAQPGHQRVQGVPGARPGRPDGVGQRTDRDRAAGVHREPDEQRAQPRPADGHLTVPGPHPHRAEDVHLHPVTVPAGRSVCAVCVRRWPTWRSWNDQRTCGGPR